MWYTKATTNLSLSSENVSTMIPKMMFNPIVVMMMKNVKSNRNFPICHE